MNNNYSMQDIYTFACKYYKEQLHFIPIKKGSKEPQLISWKEYQKRKTYYDEVDLWFKDKTNEDVGIGIITTKGLVGIDFDCPDLIEYIFGSDVDIRKITWVARTSKGIHVYLRASNIRNNVEIPGVVEIKAKGKYLVAPPSIHPDGHVYTWETDIEKVPIFKLSREQETVLCERMAFLKKNWKLINILIKAWQKGQRNQLALFIAGILRKARWSREDAENLIWILCLLNHDDEEDNRLEAVSRTWEQDIKDVAGVSKLEEFLEQGDVEQLRSFLELWKNKEKEQKFNGVQFLEHLKDDGLFYKNLTNKYFYYHKETNTVYDLKSIEYKTFLRKSWRRITGNFIKKTLLETLVEESIAEATENLKDTYLRIGYKNNTFYYDLADDQDNKIVKVTSSGWKVINNIDDDYYYERTDLSGRQVEPEDDKEFDVDKVLHELFNLRNDDDYNLLKVWLITAFVPTIPRPLLNVIGPEGSGKTKFLEFIKDIVDPCVVKTQGLKDERNRDLYIYQSYLSCFDNLSFLDTKKTKGEVSNDFARFITGQGKVDRTLYTNINLTIFEGMRLVAINGINQVVKAPDLADRTIVFELKRLTNVKSNDYLASIFEKNRGKILGWIFNALSRTCSAPEPSSSSRMQDFLLWGYKAAESIGWNGNDFVKYYKEKVRSLKEDISDEDVLIKVIKHWINYEQKWCGPATNLLAILKDEAPSINIKPEQLPANASTLSRKLGRFEGTLLEQGVQVHRRKGHGVREICISLITEDDRDGKVHRLCPDAHDDDDNRKNDSQDKDEKNAASICRDGKDGKDGKNPTSQMKDLSCDREELIVNGNMTNYKEKMEKMPSMPSTPSPDTGHQEDGNQNSSDYCPHECDSQNIYSSEQLSEIEAPFKRRSLEVMDKTEYMVELSQVIGDYKIAKAKFDKGLEQGIICLDQDKVRLHGCDNEKSRSTYQNDEKDKSKKQVQQDNDDDLMYLPFKETGRNLLAKKVYIQELIRAGIDQGKAIKTINEGLKSGKFEPDGDDYIYCYYHKQKADQDMIESNEQKNKDQDKQASTVEIEVSDEEVDAHVYKIFEQFGYHIMDYQKYMHDLVELVGDENTANAIFDKALKDWKIVYERDTDQVKKPITKKVKKKVDILLEAKQNGAIIKTKGDGYEIKVPKTVEDRIINNDSWKRGGPSPECVPYDTKRVLDLIDEWNKRQEENKRRQSYKPPLPRHDERARAIDQALNRLNKWFFYTDEIHKLCPNIQYDDINAYLLTLEHIKFQVKSTEDNWIFKNTKFYEQ